MPDNDQPRPTPTFYVDPPHTFPVEAVPPAARRFGLTWGNLTTDGTIHELHAFASRELHLPRSSFAALPYPRYRIIPSKRAAALAKGAVALEGDALADHRKRLVETRAHALVEAVRAEQQGAPTAAAPDLAQAGKVFAKFWEDLDKDICPRCQGHIDAYEKVGRSVYALPCGDRLYQGSPPKGKPIAPPRRRRS